MSTWTKRYKILKILLLILNSNQHNNLKTLLCTQAVNKQFEIKINVEESGKVLALSSYMLSFL
jgi:hypothetical protein